MPIRSFVLPEHAAANAARLSAIRGHIAVQASLFGEYPFLASKYGIVESSFGGGMEIVLTKNLGSGKEKEGNRT